MPPVRCSAVPDDDHVARLSRRRLLLGGGFVAVTAFTASRIGSSDGIPPAATSAGGAPDATTTTVPAGPASVAGAAPAPGPEHVFERVITGGRVIDPESGYDRVADVGIDGTTITAISEVPLTGTTTIDATGQVVAPGFIDLLSYEPNDYGIWFKVADGVTTNLAMHGLNSTAGDFFATYGDPGARPPCHYGGAFDHPFMRGANGYGSLAATPSQQATLEQQLRDNLAQGYLGVDVEPEYTPYVETDEILGLARVAAEVGVPVFFHARYSSPDEPGKDNAAALDEVLRVARETGASVHVEHLTSTGGTYTMETSLATLEAARAEGLDVTACCYPYDFWATYLGSARFAPGWEQRFRIGYEDLYVPGTGERLTEESFLREQARNTLVAAYAIPEDDVRAALRTPWIMLGSDGILEEGDNNHPRAAGCFARTLGRYVRDEQVLTLPEALAKMTILPAQRLQARCPALTRKGRLQLGADADITVFDPSTVADTATVDDPSQESVGISWVLVTGVPVKTPDGVDRSVRRGDPVRSELA